MILSGDQIKEVWEKIDSSILIIDGNKISAKEVVINVEVHGPSGPLHHIFAIAKCDIGISPEFIKHNLNIDMKI